MEVRQFEVVVPDPKSSIMKNIKVKLYISDDCSTFYDHNVFVDDPDDLEYEEKPLAEFKGSLYRTIKDAAEKIHFMEWTANQRESDER